MQPVPRTHFVISPGKPARPRPFGSNWRCQHSGIIRFARAGRGMPGRLLFDWDGRCCFWTMERSLALFSPLAADPCSLAGSGVQSRLSKSYFTPHLWGWASPVSPSVQSRRDRHLSVASKRSKVISVPHIQRRGWLLDRCYPGRICLPASCAFAPSL